MSPKLVMIGGMTMDWIINAEGEVGVKSCGGNTMYAAAGARFWSDDVATVSRVGADFPEHFLTSFADAGIDISHIRRVPGRHELVVAWRYDTQGNREDINPPVDLPPLGYTGPDVAEDHVVLYPTLGHLSRDGRHWIVDVHGDVSAPGKMTLGKRMLLR